MSTRDKAGLGYGTQLNEMSNNSETDSEISLSNFDVRTSDEESIPANDRFSKADRYHVVPPLITGNFLTPRDDISFAGLDEYAIRKKIIELKTTDLNTKTSETVGKITVVILVRDRCPRGKDNLPRLPIRTNIVRLATPSMGIQTGAVTPNRSIHNIRVHSQCK
ncbi:hypothetical protein Tco_0115626 [Tanacetum coccineum]